MFRKIHQTLLLVLLLIGGWGSVMLYREHTDPSKAAARNQEELDKAKADADAQRKIALEKTAEADAQRKEADAQRQEAQAQRKRAEELKQIVQRLHAEQRVAEIMVTGQDDSSGGMRETLEFTELDKDGNAISSTPYTIEGKVAHIDGLLIEFDGKFVEQNDPLRGHSIALFTGLYDQKHSPDDAYRLDKPGQIPPAYREVDPNVTRLQNELWSNFWKLAQDSNYRKSMGVRLAQGQGVWTEFDYRYKYRLSVAANGGMNVVSEKMPAGYISMYERSHHIAPTDPATLPATAPTPTAPTPTAPTPTPPANSPSPAANP